MLALVQQQGFVIEDVTTREADLEDVFVQLTSAANEPAYDSVASSAQRRSHDVLIIGSGAAGLTAALTLAQERTRCWCSPRAR